MQWTCNVRIESVKIEWRKGKSASNDRVRLCTICLYLYVYLFLLGFTSVLSLYAVFFRFIAGTGAHSIHISLNINTLSVCDTYTHCGCFRINCLICLSCTSFNRSPAINTPTSMWRTLRIKSQHIGNGIQ